MIAKLLVLITFLPCLLEARETAVSILPKKWCSYTPMQGDFTVKLPSIPKQIKEDDTELFFSNEQEITFFIFEKPLQQEELETTLHKALDTGEPYELINTRRAQFQGREALAYIYERNDQIVEGLYVASNEKLYQVFAIYEKSRDNQEKFCRFINSFQLLRAN
jgi:hypothetical protein